MVVVFSIRESFSTAVVDSRQLGPPQASVAGAFPQDVDLVGFPFRQRCLEPVLVPGHLDFAARRGPAHRDHAGGRLVAAVVVIHRPNDPNLEYACSVYRTARNDVVGATYRCPVICLRSVLPPPSGQSDTHIVDIRSVGYRISIRVADMDESRIEHIRPSPTTGLCYDVQNYAVPDALLEIHLYPVVVVGRLDCVQARSTHAHLRCCRCVGGNGVLRSFDK